MSQVILQNKIQKDYSVFKAIVDDTLTEVTADMLDGITSISSYAFYQCANLMNIEIPDSVTSIGMHAFSGCTALSSIPNIDGITIIPSGLFHSCTSLTNVTIPNSITSVGGSSFQNCTNLRDIIVPSNVVDMPGQFTFAECRSLVSCTIEAITPPTVMSYPYMFEGIYTNFKIYVPATSVDTYKAVSRWSTYASKIQPIPT